MHSFTSTVLLTLIAHYGLAAARCPAVWAEVATDLMATFIDTDGVCTDDARAAIRLSFHDCFPGTCDGSIILANECTDRGENAQMIGICDILGTKATDYDVGVADLIQFAAAMGIRSCTGGPAIAVKVGRTDSSTADAEGQIPGANDDADSIVAAFAAKGFTSTELVALTGAHSTAKDLNEVALDSTVADMDVDFYVQTSEGSTPTSLNSDTNLSNGTQTKSDWDRFGASASDWRAAFVPAMEKLGLMGNDKRSLTDCSSVLTHAFA